jgi:hypothetical protein
LSDAFDSSKRFRSLDPLQLACFFTTIRLEVSDGLMSAEKGIDLCSPLAFVVTDDWFLSAQLGDSERTPKTPLPNGCHAGMAMIEALVQKSKQRQNSPFGQTQ